MAVTTGGGEHGELLGQSGGTAIRALGTLPIAGADEDFAVPLAFFAMKFVNRHDNKLSRCTRISRRQFLAVGLVIAIPPDQGGIVGIGKNKLNRR